MSKAKLSIKKSEEREPEGLQDGGHVYISCSNCNAFLMDIWRTRPHETETWKIRASCPFCGDKSFVTEIKGGFHAGGYGTQKDDDEDDTIPSTIAESPEINGDVFLFSVKKASENAKPVYRK